MAELDIYGAERPCQDFWVAYDGKVSQAKGYECSGTPGARWFPELGFTAFGNFFTERQRAVNKARDWLFERRMELEKLERSLSD